MLPEAKILSKNQYSLDRETKSKMLLERLLALHKHHLKCSPEYKNIAEHLFSKNIKSIADFPFLPVTVFKNHELKSIAREEVFKVLTSSGTTGSVPSRIFLDRQTANLQTKALSDIMQYVLGSERLPMLLADSIGIIKDRKSFSARGAGVLGMSVIGRNHLYLLNEQMNIDRSGLEAFLDKFKGKPILIFGFTYMIWQYLYETDIKADLSGAILIHSGGWKKMLEKSVDNKTFKKKLNERFGIERIYNFYGMVEQVGSVFMECEYGYLHAPDFADVLVRDPLDFSVMPNGSEGILQVLSALPESYPGHSLLTEDLGIIAGEDNCKCLRKGKYFTVTGRMKKAELRGCSDTVTAVS